MKPPASRADSSEKFVVAMGFRGRQVEGGEGQGGRSGGWSAGLSYREATAMTVKCK